MREREACGEFDLTGKSEDGRFTVPKWARRGALVEFIEGPFAKFLGSIVKVRSATMLRIGVEFFGRAAEVDVPLDWVAWRGRGAY
jgi:hypothetical protein